jgi:hypothetical protein
LTSHAPARAWHASGNALLAGPASSSPVSTVNGSCDPEPDPTGSSYILDAKQCSLYGFDPHPILGRYPVFVFKIGDQILFETKGIHT